MTVEVDRLHLAAMERMERRMENVLRDMRILRGELEKASQDKGVLGSRSLTEFVIGLLQTRPHGLREMMELAEQAGYAVPTRRILSKRLTERKYRVGDIVCEGEVWSWKAE